MSVRRSLHIDYSGGITHKLSVFEVADIFPDLYFLTARGDCVQHKRHLHFKIGYFAHRAPQDQHGISPRLGLGWEAMKFGAIAFRLVNAEEFRLDRSPARIELPRAASLADMDRLGERADFGAMKAAQDHVKRFSDLSAIRNRRASFSGRVP